MQEAVTQRAATEPPFSGEFYRHNAPGLYRCVVCDAPLFGAEDKFHSPCGWPAFSRETEAGAVSEHKDTSHGMVRVEVRCAACGAHLGHLFHDAPTELGTRYCINSAALHFEGAEEAEGEGA